MKPKSGSSPRKVITPTGKAEALPILAIALVIFLLPVRDFFFNLFFTLVFYFICHARTAWEVGALAPSRAVGAVAGLPLFSGASFGVKMEGGGDKRS